LLIQARSFNLASEAAGPGINLSVDQKTLRDWHIILEVFSFERVRRSGTVERNSHKSDAQAAARVTFYFARGIDH